METVDLTPKSKVWSFLNQVFVGVVPHAEIDFEQYNLLIAIMAEVKGAMHTAIMDDDLRSRQWAMQVATWINGVHVANKCL